MDAKYFDAVVIARRVLTPRITEFLLGAADGGRLALAEAGSHVELRFGGTGSGRFLRHYSMVGPLTATGPAEPFWRIAVQREDRSRGSAYLHGRMAVGSRLRVSQPINVFRLVRGTPHALLVAGGIGITPMLAMARSMVWRGVPFSMLYAGLDRAAMAYVDDLAALCGKRLAVHESRHAGVADLKQLLAGQPDGTVAYVCGPPSMIKALQEAGAALGWDAGRIRFEVFNAAHRPGDEAFEVTTRSGRVIRVGAGTTILDALEAAGVDTLSDCRRGECGLCVTDVTACEGSLDHRDRFFSEADRLAGRQITLCCSRIHGHRLVMDI